MRDFVHTEDDNGGCTSTRASRYQTLQALTSTSDFQAAADTSYRLAVADYGRDAAEAKAVRDGWAGVGLDVHMA
jgi:Zn-dependent metalloprotease